MGVNDDGALLQGLGPIESMDMKRIFLKNDVNQVTDASPSPVSAAPTLPVSRVPTR